MIPAISVPSEINQAMEAGAALVISISGGKDGQTMLAALVSEYRARGWTGPLVAIHSDLGRVEWPQSLEMCEKICRQNDIELIIVRTHPAGDLIDRWKDRMRKLAGTGKPFWSSASNRYCTGEFKRDQINKYLRRFELVISAEGLRAEESPARAKKKPLTTRSRITTKRLKNLPPQEALDAWSPGCGRVSLTWYPILDWDIESVWNACGTSGADLERRRKLYALGNEKQALAGWPAHPAYVFGNERVSCMLCILASKNDLAVGAQHNPELLRTLIDMEDMSGATFKHKASLRLYAQPSSGGTAMR
jgi:3'-phosphoadenosine 5'-phosphosulfate sulfotransferase (PAPS reductase)/FAD synthetase